MGETRQNMRDLDMEEGRINSKCVGNVCNFRIQLFFYTRMSISGTSSFIGRRCQILIFFKLIYFTKNTMSNLQSMLSLINNM